MKYISITFLILLITSIQSISQDIIQTDRPDQTESASIVPIGQFQLETGSLVEFSESSTNWTLNNSLFRFAAHERFELRMVVNLIREIPTSTFLSPKNGLSDLEFGFKYGILNGPVKVAILSHGIFPTGSSAFTAEYFQLTSRLCLAHNINDRLSMGYNVGYFYRGDMLNEIYATCSAAFSLTDRIGYFLEWYGNGGDIMNIQSNMDSGFTFLYNDKVQFDISYGADMHSSNNFISFGCSLLTGK